MFSISYPSGTIRKDGVVVPMSDPDYLALLESGGAPEAIQEAPNSYPRIEVTAWKLIKALAARGWLADVEAAVAGSTDPLVKKGWERAPFYYSDEALTIGLALAIGKTRDDLQHLFELAAGL